MVIRSQERQDPANRAVLLFSNAKEYFHLGDGAISAASLLFNTTRSMEPKEWEMNTLEPSFSEFERVGWSDEFTCQKYDQHFGAVTTQSVAAMLTAAGVSKGSRVLDVCTGAGYAAGLAAARGAIATGVDFSQAQVELARERYPAATFNQGDGTALSFPDQTFDCVVNGIGIPHFSDPDAAIRESFRVLKRGGKFAFTVYDLPERAIGFGAVYRAIQTHGTMNIGLPQGPNFFLFSDPAESTKRLIAAGFDSVSVTTQPQIWRFSSMDEAFEALLNGSVRGAATLKGQGAQALEKIKAMISEIFSDYKKGEYFEVPMPVVLASAKKT